MPRVPQFCIVGGRRGSQISLLLSEQNNSLQFKLINMTENQKPNVTENMPASSSKIASEISNSGRTDFSGKHRVQFPNPPDAVNPDAATLRDQWRYAIRQYSKWYSHAWGTAILAGVSFFALGWVIKGSNPLPSFKSDSSSPSSDANGDDAKRS